MESLHPYFVCNASGRPRQGVLMSLTESEQTRYEFEVWFEYTRRAMTEIAEGTMLAVPNYATSRDESHYSVLEVTALKPIHYAIDENPTGFPAYEMEAARNAAQDWTGQDDEPTQDTTTIRCTAIPTNLELVECSRQSQDSEESPRPVLRAETNIPMVGGLVSILGPDLTERVVNRNIDQVAERDQLIRGGTLIRSSSLPVWLRVEEFLRLHFGIFGFTGSGKSNLISTYASRLLASGVPVKLVLFDLMSEYTVLLLDQLLGANVAANILILERNTLPEGVFSYINELPDRPDLGDAVDQFSRYTLIPPPLRPHDEAVRHGLRRLLEAQRIRF